MKVGERNRARDIRKQPRRRKEGEREGRGRGRGEEEEGKEDWREFCDVRKPCKF